MEPSASKPNQSALTRLMRDWKEINENKLPTIFAQPLENDMFQWVRSNKTKTKSKIEKLNYCFLKQLFCIHSMPTCLQLTEPIMKEPSFILSSDFPKTIQ